MQQHRVAVIGAGAVGASCAYHLAEAGFEVTLLDAQAPGQGASYGNACTLAHYACLPVNSPQLPRQIPSLLLARDAPLSADLSYVLTHWPWMWRFLRACSPERVAEIVRALAKLLKLSLPASLDLVHRTDSQHLLRDRAACYLYASEARHRAAQADIQRRIEQGVKITALSRDEVLDLEPAFNPAQVYAAVQFDGSYSLSDPAAWTQRIVEASGVRFVHECVQGLAPIESGMSVQLSDRTLTVEQVVLAAGAQSGRLLGDWAEAIPLDTERGYHVMFPSDASRLSCPWGVDEFGFYMTPMDQGLRVAGTVEIAGLDKAANTRRLAQMQRAARQMIPTLGEAGETWLGFRPTLPDSLPVLGRSARCPALIYAFGHQHIGLTLAALSGQIVAAVAQGRDTPCALGAFAASRFA